MSLINESKRAVWKQISGEFLASFNDEIVFDHIRTSQMIEKLFSTITFSVFAPHLFIF